MWVCQEETFISGLVTEFLLPPNNAALVKEQPWLGSTGPCSPEARVVGQCWPTGDAVSSISWAKTI